MNCCQDGITLKNSVTDGGFSFVSPTVKPFRLMAARQALPEFGISNASAQCIGYQEADDMVTLGEVYKSSQLVIVSLRVCSGPQQTRSFYRVSDRAEISTLWPLPTLLNSFRRGLRKQLRFRVYYLKVN